jgi:hypothetical protein
MKETATMTEQIGDKKTVPAARAKAADSASGASAAAGGATTAEAAAGPGFDTRHATLRYTTLRLALFLVALLLVWGVAVVANMDLSSQLSKLTLLAVALLLSSAVSFIVLSKQRDAMSAGIVARTQRLSRKFDDAASFEDDE